MGFIYLFFYVIIFNAGEDHGRDVGYLRNNTMVLAWLRYLTEQNSWK